MVNVTKLKWAGIAVLLSVVAGAGVSSCSRVNPGYVGIKTTNLGSNAGVSKDPLPIGYYFVAPTTSIVEFPVFTKTYTYTKDPKEGAAGNQEFVFQDRSGLDLAADVSIAFRVDQNLAPKLYQEYRMTLDEIINGPLRTSVRNAIITNAANLEVDEIYGPKKAELINSALRDVRKELGSKGLIVENLYWANSIRVPDNVRKQIETKIANSQAALAAQASVATAEAEARSAIAVAEGKARALEIEATAIAKNGNKVLALRAIEKWDGRLPVVTGGNNLIQVPQIPFSQGK
jgi:regulator of protease activity HflC (stomatin/prohibitin superfamily)